MAAAEAQMVSQLILKCPRDGRVSSSGEELSLRPILHCGRRQSVAWKEEFANLIEEKYGTATLVPERGSPFNP